MKGLGKDQGIERWGVPRPGRLGRPGIGGGPSAGWVRGGFSAGIALALVLFILPGAARAQEGGRAQLPLSRVVLFSSGVGFFEHQGEVEGSAQVELRFNVSDVNDLLKSMVLMDHGGGQIGAVTYGSKDPITKTLKTFAVDLTDNPTLAQLLAQVRGERVVIEADSRIEGTILGIEVRKQPLGEAVTEVEVLNLLTEQGLRSVPLGGVTAIRFVDERLNAELRQALAVLALGHATEKKTVVLNFTGQGRREVQVGYIQEAPIWKTSYRLVLEEDAPPHLQGWAIVENTTETDWNNVALTLVSGRPISFVMNLYDPLYVPRPVVEPELFASLRPQKYQQDLAAAEAEFRKQADGANAQPAAPADKLAAGRALRRNRAAEATGRAGALDLRQGVRSLAEATEAGELFQYRIEGGVTLARQQSAMLPIVNESVEGEKVSIFTPAVHPKHPLNGLQLVNSTELHLMQGPITVFDGGTYAGDAQIEDLAPGTRRLISYALDLDTEVVAQSTGSSDLLVSCKLTKGLLLSTRKLARSQTYTVKNSGRRQKKVLIEQPYDSLWKLIEPQQPAEQTRDLYRFAVMAQPGKPVELKVSEERRLDERVALNNLDDNTINIYLNAPVVSQAVKDALGEIIRRKREIAEIVQARQNAEQQIAIVDQEQARIRQNMAQLERNSELYNRYVQKFSEQEDRVEQLRQQIGRLTEREQELRKALDDYLLRLEVE